MLKVDNVPKDQPKIFYILDYLWSGFASIGIVFVFLGFWEWGSLLFGEFLLPSPQKVFFKAYELLQNIKENQIDISFIRAVFGVGLSLVIGITTGLIAGANKSLLAFLNPLIIILLSMPPIIWIVLALFWFGFGDSGVFFTIIIIISPMTFASAALAMASVKQANIELFEVYEIGIFKQILYLYLPHLTKYLISSLSVAVSSGVKVVVMAELLGSSSGIGAKIADSRAMLDTTEVMAFVVLIITFVGIFEYLITRPLEIIFMPWKR